MVKSPGSSSVANQQKKLIALYFEDHLTFTCKEPKLESEPLKIDWIDPVAEILLLVDRAYL